MEKKYQIFISSTYEDLKNERKKVRDAILSMCHFPIGMEFFSAADEKQWEIIKDSINSSDYFILIIGKRYGSIIEEGNYAGMSYTEKEFTYAINKGIPVLAFLIDKSVPRTDEQRENNKKKQNKLNKFIDKVKKDRIVEWWTSTDDLVAKVVNALTKQIAKGKRLGWIRVNSNNDDYIELKNVGNTKSILEIIETTKTELFISGITLKSWIGYYTHLLDRPYLNIKIVALNINNKSLLETFKEMRGSNLDVPSLEFLKGLQSHPNIEIRLINSMMPLLFVASDIETDQGYIKIQHMMNNTGSSKVPYIELKPSNKWYNNYKEQINTIWNRSATWIKSE